MRRAHSRRCAACVLPVWGALLVAPCMQAPRRVPLTSRAKPEAFPSLLGPQLVMLCLCASLPSAAGMSAHAAVQRGGRRPDQQAGKDASKAEQRGASLLPACPAQVLWLDLTAAKARYGRWLGAALPGFVPFQRTTRARTKAQKGAEAAAKHSGAGGTEAADDGLLVCMRRLRCGGRSCTGPLLPPMWASDGLPCA